MNSSPGADLLGSDKLEEQAHTHAHTQPSRVAEKLHPLFSPPVASLSGLDPPQIPPQSAE